MNILKCNLFLWEKLFSASLLQSSVSHDPSEIILICWFAAQQTFLIIVNVESSCAYIYTFISLWKICFLRWIESLKKHLFERENFIMTLLSLLNNLMHHWLTKILSNHCQSLKIVLIGRFFMFHMTCELYFKSSKAIHGVLVCIVHVSKL